MLCGSRKFGAINLTSLCQNDPVFRLVVAFSSLAGRFGSAAEVGLFGSRRFARSMGGAGGTAEGRRGIGLVWSGWGSIGVAFQKLICGGRG